MSTTADDIGLTPVGWNFTAHDERRPYRSGHQRWLNPNSIMCQAMSVQRLPTQRGLSPAPLVVRAPAGLHLGLNKKITSVPQRLWYYL